MSDLDLKAIEARAARVATFTTADGGLAEACGRAIDSAEDVPALVAEVRELTEQRDDAHTVLNNQSAALPGMVEELRILRERQARTIEARLDTTPTVLPRMQALAILRGER